MYISPVVRVGEVTERPIYGTSTAWQGDELSAPAANWELAGWLNGILSPLAVLGRNTTTDRWELHVVEQGFGSIDPSNHRQTKTLRTSGTDHKLASFMKLSADRAWTEDDGDEVDEFLHPDGFYAVGSFTVPVLFPNVTFVVAEAFRYYTLSFPVFSGKLSVSYVNANTNVRERYVCNGNNTINNRGNIPCGSVQVKRETTVDVATAMHPDDHPNHVVTISEWTGACAEETAQNCNFTMDGDKSVSATFSYRRKE